MSTHPLPSGQQVRKTRSTGRISSWVQQCLGGRSYWGSHFQPKLSPKAAKGPVLNPRSVPGRRIPRLWPESSPCLPLLSLCREEGLLLAPGEQMHIRFVPRDLGGGGGGYRVPHLVPQRVTPLAPSPAVFPVSLANRVRVCSGSDRSHLVFQDLVSRSPPGKQM